MAGLAAAAHALGTTADAAEMTTLRRSWQRASRFSSGFAPMVAPRDAAAAHIADDTIVCRCESLRRGEIDAAVSAGAQDLNQLKQWTRCGMGPCQGRFCGETAAGLLGAHGIGREQAGQWSGRAPLRPVDLTALCGQFDYADIPIPKPAPL
jgi:bacterioferritin-associated ferredoxin